MLRRSLLNPAGREQLLTVPLSLLQQELPHLGQVFGLHIETPATGVDALRTLIPVCPHDT